MRTRKRWKALLFPDPERTFPAERWVRILLRTAHLTSMAAYVGGTVFAVPDERLHGALALTVLTGALFVLLEAYGTLNWLFEVRGLATLAKIALLLLVPVLPGARVALLFTVLALGAVSSHMSARLRYHSVLTGRPARDRRG